MLPFTLGYEQINLTSSSKADATIIDFVKRTLISGMNEKKVLKDVSRHITDTLDTKEGGFWLCNISPLEIENGLIKSDSKGMILTFKRSDLVYQVQVSQTKNFVEVPKLDLK